MAKRLKKAKMYRDGIKKHVRHMRKAALETQHKRGSRHKIRS